MSQDRSGRCGMPGRLAAALARASVWRQMSAVLDLGTAALTAGVLTLLTRES